MCEDVRVREGVKVCVRRGEQINEPHLPGHKKADLDVIRKVTHCAGHVQPIVYLRSTWPTSEVYSQHTGTGRGEKGRGDTKTKLL